MTVMRVDRGALRPSSLLPFAFPPHSFPGVFLGFDWTGRKYLGAIDPIFEAENQGGSNAGKVATISD